MDKIRNKRSTNPNIQISFRDQFENLNRQHLFIASPTLRTIETTNLLTETLAHPQKYISPIVGPRVFPLHAESMTEICDLPLPSKTISSRFPDYMRLNKTNEQLWDDGINTIEQSKFNAWGEQARIP